MAPFLIRTRILPAARAWLLGSRDALLRVEYDITSAVAMQKAAVSSQTQTLCVGSTPSMLTKKAVVDRTDAHPVDALAKMLGYLWSECRLIPWHI